MRYKEIKRLARENGYRIKDLIAMTPQTDPFYCEVPYKIKSAEWFTDVFNKYGGTGYHLRRFHYKIIDQVTKPDGKIYENIRNDWGFLCSASVYARHLDLVPYDAFVDRRNPPPKVTVSHLQDPLCSADILYYYMHLEDLVPSVSLNLNLSKFHSYHIEIWTEKSTMDDILIPLCEKYMVFFLSGAGYESLTHIDQLLKRVLQIGKPCRIFYISDYDNAGQAMPRQVARNLEYRIDKEGLRNKVDIKLKPIILLKEHVRKYHLPSAPDSKQTELDALEALYPGELEKIVRSYLDEYIDLNDVEETKKAMEVERDRIQEEINKIVTYRFGNEIKNCRSRLTA